MDIKLEPIYDLRSGQPHGVECLCARRVPGNVDAWRLWYQHLITTVSLDVLPDDVFVAINLDADHLLDQNIVGLFDKLSGYPIMLEWTERGNAATDNFSGMQAVADILEGLRIRHGFRIALDDMGSGEDGLRRLSLVNPDLIKIDGNLFKLACQKDRVAQLLEAHIRIYNRYAPVVVEWIETTDDYRLAINLGGMYGQGYYWEDRGNEMIGETFKRIMDRIRSKKVENESWQPGVERRKTGRVRAGVPIQVKLFKPEASSGAGPAMVLAEVLNASTDGIGGVLQEGAPKWLVAGATLMGQIDLGRGSQVRCLVEVSRIDRTQIGLSFAQLNLQERDAFLSAIGNQAP